MDFVTDIETPLLYWVGRIEESPDDDLRLWGTSPAGTYGFGGEERSYTGDVFIISNKGRREEKKLSIMQGHVNSQRKDARHFVETCCTSISFSAS